MVKTRKAMTTSKLSRLFASKWLVTLTATLIGTFLALYLNERVAIRKVNQQKTIASKNIREEIQMNREELEKSLKQHEQLLDVVIFMEEYYNSEDEKLIVHKDTMNAFRTRNPEILSEMDSTQVEGDIYDYSGQIDLDISYSHINLTTIAWETLLNSGITSAYQFNCLMSLSRLYKITDMIIEESGEVSDQFIRIFYETDDVDFQLFTMPLRRLILNEGLLLDFYEHYTEEEFDEACS